MLHWNHRIIKKKDEISGRIYFGIYEVTYDAKGDVLAYSESAASLVGDTIEDLRKYLEWTLDAFDTEVLEEDKITAEIQENKRAV